MKPITTKALTKKFFKDLLSFSGLVLMGTARMSAHAAIHAAPFDEDRRNKQRAVESANMNWVSHNCDPLYTPGSTMNPIKKQ